MASTGLPHGNFHEDGNNAPHTPCTPQPIFECYQTRPPAFSSDNHNQNDQPNPLLSNVKISHEVSDLTSNAVINYISQILLEENIDEDFYQEEAALRDTEKSFYDILKNECPFPPTWTQFHTTKSSNTTDSGSSNTTEIGSKNDMPSCSKSKLPLISTNPISASSIENLTATQIQKGAEEAMKFLPAIGKLFIGLEPNKIEINEEDKTYYVSENKAICDESHTKKCTLNDRGSDLSEGQARKQRAVSSDEPARNEHLEQFLLFRDREYVKEVISLRKTEKQGIKNNSWEHQEDKQTKNEIRKKETRKDLVDLESLLIRCSEAVSTNDYNQACELISEIRKHSSPKGDCYQRLAHYLADALEARLAGTGSDIYRELLSRQGNMTDILKATRIYFAICPFLRASYYFSNQTILNVSKSATKVHIIDFGINWGFMWPSFFERLSSLGSGAPKIRITGIGFPERGFRPGKLIEEIGRRLSEYAQRFNIHFEYQGIASRWENITIEDLKIDKNEVLVVNCLYGLKNIADETIAMNSPRDKVLRIIKEIKPCVFIHGILNGSYGTPFFTARFKEVLSSFFSFLDIYEATMYRESEMRIHIERNIIIPSAINAIACEGSERVERPETYKQWQARTIRAGFTQLPVDSIIMKNIENSTRELYHKEFFVDEDRKWLRLGWKGAILFALSIWKPNDC